MLTLTIHKNDPIRFEEPNGRLIGTIEIAEKSTMEFCRLAFDFPPEYKIVRKKARKPFDPKDYGAKK